MGQPAARMGDTVTGVDVHIVLVPSPGGPVPTPLPHPFVATIMSGASSDVLIGGQPAATIGSGTQNSPVHMPMPPGTAFQVPPSNTGTVMQGSATVLINGKGVARIGDQVMTCNDPAPLPGGSITTGCVTVMVG